MKTSNKHSRSLLDLYSPSFSKGFSFAVGTHPTCLQSSILIGHPSEQGWLWIFLLSRQNSCAAGALNWQTQYFLAGFAVLFPLPKHLISPTVLIYLHQAIITPKYSFPYLGYSPTQANKLPQLFTMATRKQQQKNLSESPNQSCESNQIPFSLLKEPELFQPSERVLIP